MDEPGRVHGAGGMGVLSDPWRLVLLAESPVSIGPGGDILNGRIYFGSGSHVYSYQVPQP